MYDMLNPLTQYLLKRAKQEGLINQVGKDGHKKTENIL